MHLSVDQITATSLAQQPRPRQLEARRTLRTSEDIGYADEGNIQYISLLYYDTLVEYAWQYGLPAWTDVCPVGPDTFFPIPRGFRGRSMRLYYRSTKGDSEYRTFKDIVLDNPHNQILDHCNTTSGRPKPERQHPVSWAQIVEAQAPVESLWQPLSFETSRAMCAISAMASEHQAASAPIWDLYRPIITDLYIKEDWELNEIQAYMARTYGHCATPQMYKKRFAKWKVRKNYTQPQKQQAMIILRRSGASKIPMTAITINGKPLKQDRLRRAVQRKGQLFRLDPCEQPKQDNAYTSTQQPRLQEPFDLPYLPGSMSLHRQVPPSSETRDEIMDVPLELPRCTPSGHTSGELFFLDATHYYEWFCANGYSVDRYIYSKRLADMLENIRSARAVFAHDVNAAFRLFNRALLAVPRMLEEQSLQLLNQLIVEFQDCFWLQQQQVRALFLECIVHMSRKRDHIKHNALLTGILARLLDSALVHDFAAQAIGLAPQVVSRCQGPQENAMKVQIHAIISQLELGNTELAEKQCWSVLENARKQKLSRVSSIELHALEKLAYIRWKQHRDDEARLLCLEVLQRNIQKHNNVPVIGVGADACQILAQLCLEREDYHGAEPWQILCVEGALFESKMPVAFRHVQMLEYIYLEQGRIEDIQELRSRLSYMYQQFESG